MKLSQEDCQELARLDGIARTTPFLIFGPGRDTSSIAWARVREKWLELGRKYGFDPWTVAIDSESGEITPREAAR